MRVAVFALSALLAVSAVAQDKDTIIDSKKYGAKMTHTQELELENDTLKMNNALLLSMQSAKAEYEQATGEINIERIAIIKAVLEKNPTLEWNPRQARFVPKGTVDADAQRPGTPDPSRRPGNVPVMPAASSTSHPVIAQPAPDLPASVPVDPKTITPKS